MRAGPAPEPDYFGVLVGKGACIARRFAAAAGRQVQVHYFPGATIALRLAMDYGVRFPVDLESREFRA